MRVGSGASLVLTSVATAAAAAAIEAAWWRPSPAPARMHHAVAGRDLSKAAALLAVAALADSGVEHYRGAFHNKTMALPLAVAAQALGASLHGIAETRPNTSTIRAFSNALALTTGLAGTGFHFYNILKRPGGWSWHNLFYAAPIGAPMSLSLAGMLGRLAELVRRGSARSWGMLPGPLIARLVALGLAGTTGEAALLHFRGAYHNPAMVVPVTAPPVAAALLTGATVCPRLAAPARWAMRLLTAIGLAGAGFHAYGVSRNMGGWRNWSQNVLNGPPLPAPPAFTALALAGLAALRLMEEER
ncbi:MAG: hypothetical protein JO258_02410 [Alphaproteobacteria bacterium]|nr:hypothetical protein [Alphaproteobacteria bacterium]